MKARCTSAESMRRWSHQGCLSALPSELEQHASACRDCARFVSDVLELRRVLAAAPEIEPDAGRIDALRFELMAAARQARRAPAPRPRLRRARDLLAASVCAVLAALAVYVALSGAERARVASVPAASPPAAQSVHVTLGEGARGEAGKGRPDAVYALHLGTATFAVHGLAPGETYRIEVGHDRVEVRGTRFSVTAADGQLREVSVLEGEVLVAVAGAAPIELGAGETWRRPMSAPAGTAARAPLGETPDDDARFDTGRARHSEFARAARAAERGAANKGNRREDAEFRRAFELFNSARVPEAASAFDALARSHALDPSRRADVLYWSARAHRRAGNTALARERAHALLESEPGAWHASHAALLLAELLAEEGDLGGARRWLERAEASPHPAVRASAGTLAQKLRRGADF